MSTDPNCPRCGAPLASDGLCARCELALALEHPLASTELVETADFKLKRFGDYELLEELGHGGMGVVYKARHVKLKRIVALKMLLLGQFSSESSVERFQREAQAAAALHHPNIVSVYDVGQVEGQHYFTMEYVEGRSLASILRDGPLPASQAANYCHAIAEAIGVAHAAGILHRDLKPSNIVIDPCFDRPFITDFGLAKRFTESEDSPPSSELTVTGQILGSPNYLAPELAAGKLGQVGPSSDLFSIGAMLYECLTGRPPFIASTLQETLLRIRDTEPVAPRTLTSGVPRDLETICLKCLQKEPSKRYATGQELADDLNHFLHGEPILARPIGPTARLWRWCRRKPLVAALVLALHLAFALGLAGVLWQWRRAELNATEEARERHRAEAGERSAQLNQYVSDMNLVQLAWEGGNVKRAQSLLQAHIPKPGQPDFRGFEWRYLWKLCQDQSRLTFTNFPGGVALAISPDGKFAATTSYPVIKLLDFVNGKELDTLIQQGVTRLSFSPKVPNILATGCTDGTVRLWDLGTRQSLCSLRSDTNETTGVAFSPDGKLLASTTEQGVTLWNVENRASVWARLTPTAATAPSFTPDGRSLVTGGGEDFSLIVWDLNTTNSWTFPPVHTGWIQVAAFSPDGKLLVTGGEDGRTILWDYTLRTPLQRLMGHHGPSLAAQFSPDGRYLASGGEDATIRLWDVASREPVTVLRGHQGGVVSVAFTPDGRSLLSSTMDHMVKVWDTKPKPEVVALQPRTTWANCPFFSPDGTRLISVHIHESFTRLWDVASQRSIAVFVGPTNPLSATFSQDGNQLAVSGRDHTVWFWSLKTLQLDRILTNHFEAGSVSLSRDNRVLAAAGQVWWGQNAPDPLEFWSLDPLQRINKALITSANACAVAFAHQSDLLAVGCTDGTVRLWDFQNQKLLKEFHEHRDLVMNLAFCDDDALLATCSDDATVVLYDVRARRAFPPLGDHASHIWSVGFTPDGRTLASASYDGTVKLWNVATRQVALSLSEHLGPVSGVSFSPKGDLMATSGADGTVRLWSAPPLAEIHQNSVTPSKSR